MSALDLSDWAIAFCPNGNAYIGRVLSERTDVPAISLSPAYTYMQQVQVDARTGNVGVNRLVLPLDMWPSGSAIGVAPCALLRLSTLEGKDVEELRRLIDAAEKTRQQARAAQAGLLISPHLPRQ